MLRSILLCSILFAGSFHGLAQIPFELNTSHYDANSGLSNNQVNDFTQDKNGFIWIATANGLNRFDGKTFKNFTKNYSDSNSLYDNLVNRIAVDGDNNIWIGYATEGISKYNQVTRTFTHFLPDKDCDSCLMNGMIDKLFIDSNQKLWIGVAFAGLMSMDLKTGDLKNYGELPYVSKQRTAQGRRHYNRISEFIEDDKGILWIATGDGLYSLNPESGQFEVYRFYEGDENIDIWKPDIFNTICAYKKEGFYVAGWGTGLNYFNLTTKKWQTFLIDKKNNQSGTHNIITSLRWRNENELWVGSIDTCLSIFNVINNTYHHISPDQLNSTELSGLFPTMLFTDRDGDLWIGHQNGFHFLNQATPLFNFHPLPVTRTTNSDHYRVITVLDDSVTGKKLISTIYADGLNIIEPNGDQNHILIDSVAINKSNQFCTSVLRDRKGKIWVLTLNNLFTFNPKNNKLENPVSFNSDKLLPGEPLLRELIEGPDGSLWITTYNHGIFNLDPETNTSKQYFQEPKNNNSLLSNRISGIDFDKNGILWIGYDREGISSLDIKKIKYRHFTNKRDDLSTLIDNRVMSVRTDFQNRVWVGTYKGLSIISDDGSISNLNFEQQMLGSFVAEIFRDNRNNMWCSTAKGLMWINPVSGEIRLFNHNDGLPHQYDIVHFTQGRDNIIYIGYDEGYYTFSDSIPLTKFKPANVTLTSFASGDSVISFEDEIINTGKISLDPDHNLFTAEFISLNYKSPGEITYKFRLKGIDKEWQTTGNKGFASYHNLPGGEYTFEIIPEKNGIKGDISSVSLFIATPFYKTGWFGTLVALVFASLIYALYQYRVRSVEKTEALKTKFNKQIAEIEMRALRAQMNPHFIFNCLNSINRYIIKQDHKTASLYLTKFAKLIRLILDSSEQHEVPLSQEIDALKIYIDIESLRFDNRFSYSIEVDESIYTDTISVPPMIIQPFVENAIWHGLLHKDTPGFLSIRFLLKENTLACIVEDNGVGRKRAAAMKSKSATTRKSLGLKITADRLEILNERFGLGGGIEFEDLHDDSENPSGTRVIINIPVELN